MPEHVDTTQEMAARSQLGGEFADRSGSRHAISGPGAEVLSLQARAGNVAVSRLVGQIASSRDPVVERIAVTSSPPESSILALGGAFLRVATEPNSESAEGPVSTVTPSVAHRVDARDQRIVDPAAAKSPAVQRSVAQLDEIAQRTLPDLSPEAAAQIVRELTSSAASLAQFGPRRCLIHLLQAVAAGTEMVTRAELDRRSNAYSHLVVVRPDGYWSNALTGTPLQRAFPASRVASPPYAIGQFYYSHGGVMYETDAALNATGGPVAELGLEHDVVNSALDGIEDAAISLARGLAQLILHPIQTIGALVQLPSALAKLIASSPEYWEQFKALPLADQIRKSAELVSTLLLMYGTAVGTTSTIAAAAADVSDVTINVLRLQAGGTFAVAEVVVPVGTVATALRGGPGAIYVLSMMNAAGSGGGGSGSGGGKPLNAAVRELDTAADAARPLTDLQREAMEWNAQAIADTTGVPLASGRIAWKSLLNQLSRPRWRFLNQAPEAARIWREMLNRLPDGPYAAGDPTKAQLLAKFGSW